MKPQGSPYLWKPQDIFMSTEIRKALVEERRKRFLESLIGEAIINVLAEQEQGETMASPAAATPAAAAPQSAPAPMQPPETPAETNPEQPFTVDDMIERLNVIRGGRSFTDPEVYGRLVTYFKTLDEPSRDSLEKFLVELGKIVIDVGQEQQKEPAEATPPPAAEPPPAPVTPPSAPQAPISAG